MMVVKRKVGVLLAGTVLGACFLAAVPAFAQDAQSQQKLQNEINGMQKQLREMQAQLAQAKQQANAAQKAVENVPPSLYNAAPPGAPLVTKGPSFLDTVHISMAGSFIAMEGAWRERNELSSGASDPAFSSLPFSNTPLYHENELRFSAQQSRIALKVTGDIDPTQHLKGYYESDWLGAGVTANSRESNSYNLRIRQAFFQYDNDNYHFHFSAGQQWSFLTQDRVGMLPNSENVPLTIDAQYVVGFNWARQPSIRFVEDLNKFAWFGVSVESPQAAIGGTLPASGAAFPFAVNAANNCNNSGLLDDATSCSNDVAPDIIEKFALDPGWGHYEAFAVQRWFAASVSPFVSPTTPAAWSTHTTFGWDVGGSALMPVVPKFLDLQGSVMYGQGGGRYGSSQLADVTYGANGALQALPYLGAMVGAVAHPWDGLDVYVYAGQEQVRATSFGTGAGAGGYGNPLFANNGCLLANPAYANNPGGIGTASFNSPIAGTTCTANVQKTQEITVGFWQDAYKGAMGRVRVGLEYEYIRLTAFGTNCTLAAAAGCTPSAISTPNAGLNPNNNVVFLSLRYYPFN
jgi:hypothetical protein